MLRVIGFLPWLAPAERALGIAGRSVGQAATKASQVVASGSGNQRTNSSPWSTKDVRHRVLKGDRSPQIMNLPLFSPAECDRAWDTIRALRKEWIGRHPSLPFYTLGATNYYDIPDSDDPSCHADYLDKVQQCNPSMERDLGWLYKRLAHALSLVLRAPVEYPGYLALPGFHIFEGHDGFGAIEDPDKLVQHVVFFEKLDGSPVHVDGAHLTVEWMDESAMDLERPISFTVPITRHGLLGKVEVRSAGAAAAVAAGKAARPNAATAGEAASIAAEIAVERAGAGDRGMGGAQDVEQKSPDDGDAGDGDGDGDGCGRVGMRIWHLHRNDIKDIEDTETVGRRLQALPSFLHDYELGKMAFHGGQWYHQAKGFPVSNKASRVTLQGHGVFDRSAQAWQLFW